MYNELIIKLPFDVKHAVSELSAEAFFMLNVMYYAAKGSSDVEVMSLTKFGKSRHVKYKKQLVVKGYLVVNQVGKGKYKYIIGGINE